MRVPSRIYDAFDHMHEFIISGRIEAAYIMAPTLKEKILAMAWLKQVADERGVSVLFFYNHPALISMELRENAQLPIQQLDTVCKELANAKR